MHVDRQKVLVGNNVLEIREGVDALPFGYIIRPWQTTHQLLVHEVGERFRHGEAIAVERPRKPDARAVAGNAGDVTVFNEE